MTISESKKRLNEAIKKLNSLQKALVFEVEETDYSIGFTNCGKNNPYRTYGAYAHTSFFDEYKKKADAYINAVMFAELIIAAADLNDAKAYHNICELGCN